MPIFKLLSLTLLYPVRPTIERIFHDPRAGARQAERFMLKTSETRYLSIGYQDHVTAHCSHLASFRRMRLLRL